MWASWSVGQRNGWILPYALARVCYGTAPATISNRGGSPCTEIAHPVPAPALPRLRSP